MKNFKFYTVLLGVFFLFNTTDLLAQKNKGKKNYEKARKEYYKKQEKNRKHVQKQYKNKHKNNKHSSYVVTRKRNGPPSWAPAHGYRAKHHVYFRDYYTFYDPYRGGYVYMHQNKWLFSRDIPAFLVGIDLNRARVQLITDIPLNSRPERYYSRYSNQYPRDPSVRINISLF